MCTLVKAQTDSLKVSESDSLLLLNDSGYFAQKAFVKGFRNKWNMQPHSPLKATLKSAVIPGWGQMYNGKAKEGSFARKYWKVPIVYAGIGTCIGFIIYNDQKYQYFKREYIYQADNDPNTNPVINASNLFEIQDQYHRWRDVSYFCLAGVYILQVIEANVDAHLFYYDVGKDLSMQLHPTLIPQGSIRPGIGLSLTF